VRSRYGDVLGGRAVAIERGECVHGVADRHVCHVGRDLGDDARQLVRRDRREAVDRPLELVPRDGGGEDLHERLAGAELGDRDVVEAERFDTSGFMQADGSHSAPLSRTPASILLESIL
jgi:hypothetical protein